VSGRQTYPDSFWDRRTDFNRDHASKQTFEDVREDLGIRCASNYIGACTSVEAVFPVSAGYRSGVALWLWVGIVRARAKRS